MAHLDAKLLTVVTLAALLAAVLARLLAWRFRRAMQGLMQVAVQASADAAAAAAPAQVPMVAPQRTPAAPVTLADNRRAAWRVSGLLLLLTALVALASAMLQLPQMGRDLSLRRALVLGLAQTWPAIPVLALLWRWPRRRTLGALALWALLAAGVMALNMDGEHPLRAALVYLLVDAGFALAWALLLCAGPAARAIAPWLMLPLAAVLWGAIVGLDLMERAIANDQGWLPRLAAVLGADATMALLFFGPVLLLAWPALRLGRALAWAWRRRWLSELMVLFTVLTGLALLQRMLTALGSSGTAALALLLPLLLVPPVVLLAAPRDGRGGVGSGQGGAAAPEHAASRPPVLLVLRVFQRDKAVSALFDRVIERWRLTGNTLLIAGTDLLERTLDADDLWTFIGGRLRSRFVFTPADLQARLQGVELARDLDGRHRVNEIYCHDRTWQLALDALVAQSDVVLMDLRSFQQRNRGCLHELAVLAAAPQLARVVVLVDAQTDLATARQAAAAAPPGRFEWLDTDDAGQVLARLFVAG